MTLHVRHEWVEKPLKNHTCSPLSYCHHWLGKCRICGEKRVMGFAVEEVR